MLQVRNAAGQAGGKENHSQSGGFWIVSLEKGDKESPVGFFKQREKKNQIMSVMLEKQSKTSD